MKAETERGYCDFCGKRRVIRPTPWHDEGSALMACRECERKYVQPEDRHLNVVKDAS